MGSINSFNNFAVKQRRKIVDSERKGTQKIFLCSCWKNQNICRCNSFWFCNRKRIQTNKRTYTLQTNKQIISVKKKLSDETALKNLFKLKFFQEKNIRSCKRRVLSIIFCWFCSKEKYTMKYCKQRTLTFYRNTLNWLSLEKRSLKEFKQIFKFILN